MEQSISKENYQSLEKELIVNNKLGVHARPAAMIVRITSNFSGDV